MFVFFKPAEMADAELSKQREVEKEKEDLMDEGDFLEYKVSRKQRNLLAVVIAAFISAYKEQA